MSLTSRSPANPACRRSLIGGSDARIISGADGGSDVRLIMANDEARLLRPWRENRGEAEPENLTDKPSPVQVCDRAGANPCTSPALAAHASFVAALSGQPPRAISLDADALDLEDRADHLGQVFTAPRCSRSDQAPQPAFRFFGLPPLSSGSLSRICNMAVVRRRIDSARDGRSGWLRRHSSKRSKNSFESRI
jgi:hypothetical protein